MTTPKTIQEYVRRSQLEQQKVRANDRFFFACLGFYVVSMAGIFVWLLAT